MNWLSIPLGPRGSIFSLTDVPRLSDESPNGQLALPGNHFCAVRIQQVGKDQKGWLLCFDVVLVYRNGGGDDAVDEIGLAEMLAVKKHQGQVQETFIQVVEACSRCLAV